MTIRVSKDRIDMDDKVLQKPVLKDYGETVVTANSSTAYTINLTAGNVFNITLTGNCAFTFSNPSASGSMCTFTLILTQDGTGSRTATWPNAVTWRANGGKPVLSTAAASVDILTFTTTDGGATWFGSIAGLNMKTPPIVTYLTSGTSWSVPTDWNSSNNTIEVIGGGGGGNSNAATSRGGGGGGAYSKASNVSLTPGATITYAVGAAGTANNSGGDSYLCNSTSNCATIAGSAVVAGAKGGNGGATFTGGAAGSGVGSVKYSGGNGGTNSSDAGAGGGGAAGPSGNGGNGGNAGTTGGGGGGGANGGSAGSAGSGSSGGAGGSNVLGYGKGIAGSPGTTGREGAGGGGGNNGLDGGDGGRGSLWDSTRGPGGGGGAAGHDYNSAFPSGGLYGGGGAGKGNDNNGSGGAGGQGIIVITYTPS